MAFLKLHRVWSLIILILIVGSVLCYVLGQSQDINQGKHTAIVDRGDVRNVVSVSGYVEAEDTAHLSFPTVGVVTGVFFTEGSTVKKGDTLATIGSRKLVAQRNEMVAQLQKIQSLHIELLQGPTAQERAVTDTSVQNAATFLQTTITTEKEKVSNAKQTLLSATLEAHTTNTTEDATPPDITGSYTCTKGGNYTLSVYGSGSYSGFTYTLSGLETGINEVSSRQPTPLGTCGLYIQFTAGDHYANSEWNVAIPNTLSSSYITYKNAYELALKQEAQNVQAAKDAYVLTKKMATQNNADPRTEAVTQSNASIAQARAQIEAIDAQIKDLSIIAPFDGIITNVNIVLGETAGLNPIITLLSNDVFTLTARIPEIDITKVRIGQKTNTIFDARTTESFNGKITFISPLATQIDGVAYFATKITLAQPPEWMRSGLNADIDILIDIYNNTIRIPKQFLITDQDTMTYVLAATDGNNKKLPINVTGYGNDGFIAINGVQPGTTIIAP